MQKKIYRKPLLGFTLFTPNEYISSCEPEIKNQVIYDESTFYTSIYWDINVSGDYNTGEYFSFSEKPSPLYMDILASSQQGYYKNNGFVNQPSRPGQSMNFYRSNKYSTNTKLKSVYAVRDEDGKDFYFNAAPTLQTVEKKNQS